MSFQKQSFVYLALGLLLSAGSIEAKNNCFESKRKNFHFSALGDSAYDIPTENALKVLINEVINKEDNAFVVHIGDTQTDARGLSFIDQALLQTVAKSNTPAPGVPPTNPPYGFVRNRSVLWQIKAPFLVTPADNDWTDTTFAPVLNEKPLDTLNAFREVFYNEGTNVCFPFKVVSQPDEMREYSAYVENKRWIYNGIVFVTVHTLGESDGTNGKDTVYGTQVATDEINREYLTRNAANVAWLQKAFDEAERIQAPGVVVFTHSQPGLTEGTDFTNVALAAQYPYGNWNFADEPDAVPNPGWDDVLSLLYHQVTEHPERKVLYIYGNNHMFNVISPWYYSFDFFNQIDNFVAIQVPGWPDTGRLRFSVDFDDPDLFKLSLDIRNIFPIQTPGLSKETKQTHVFPKKRMSQYSNN